MSRNVGPEGKALETVRIPQVPAAVGGGGGVHVGDKAGCADSVYAGETLLPLVNSSAEFRRPCGNVQGPGRKHHGGWNTDGSRENMKWTLTRQTFVDKVMSLLCCITEEVKLFMKGRLLP